jgi:uncharacterized protein
MKLYFDTSILIPLLLPEETSDRIELFFQNLPANADLIISQWARVEFVSVLSRLVRMGELERRVALLCSNRFCELLAESFQIALPSPSDFDLCWKFMERFDNSLRAGDALHLAIASNLAVETIFSLDKGMIKNGRHLGLSVETGISF